MTQPKPPGDPMKLGLQLGYWSAGPPAGAQDLVVEAERLGYDSVWTAESWGSDALTPLAWWGSQTSRIRLGTDLMQLSARQPTATAMAALTMDHLSGAGSCSASGSPAPRSSRAWYGMPFRSRWPGPGSTWRSSARCWPARSG